MPEEQLICKECNEPVGDYVLHIRNTGHTTFGFINLVEQGV